MLYCGLFVDCLASIAYLKASPLPPAPAEAQRFGSSEALGLGGSEAWGLGVLQEQVLGALDVF